MKKIEVKVVIGSNYGDECKGLATRFFSEQKTSNQHCLNVLFNGGCQRGHTVELRNGIRHVFHHFGCGTYSDSDTYFDQNFMINPISFIQEYSELSSKVKFNCLASRKCRVSTPYDSFINQIVESYRNNKHGSCGYGIWETQKRYEDGRYAIYLKDLLDMSDQDILNYLSDISHKYLPERLRHYMINEIPEEYFSLINCDGLSQRFLEDIRLMQSVLQIKEFENIANDYDLIVFEGAQGLGLDENNIEAYPHVTASSTTSMVPVQRVKNLNCNIEICYITRSYFTRHGAGPFPTECYMNMINPEIEDNTNITNIFQDSIRYGLFDEKEFIARISKDKKNSSNLRSDITFSLFISHLNYTNNDIFGNSSIKSLSKYFDKIYLSSTKYAEDVKIFK